MHAKHQSRRRGAALVAALLLVCGAASAANDRNLAVDKKPAGAERRLALVIGNGTYGSAPLRNPTNDARAVAQALRGLGFEVSHHENLGLKAMARSIRDFGTRLKEQGGIGLFYYAGHGMQVRGRNYLIPVDADIQSEDEIAFNAVDANLVLEKMDAANNGLNVVILDACRNNPFARSFRSAAQGLAQMDAPSGTLIAFATAPGSVASDGEGANGVYTKHLIEHMAAPGVPVEQLFKRVRIAVTRETRDRQVPWESSSLKGDFYFKPPQVAVAVPPPAAAGSGVSADAIELAFWDSIKASRVPSDFEAYLEQYPKGRFAALARARVKQLGEEAKERPTAFEMAYWDSIKASASIADFQSYLEQYPNGRFAALARNRIAALQQQGQRPSAATQTAATGAGRAIPQVGDRWTYRHIDGWKNAVQREIAYEVTEVSAKGIQESFSVDNVAVGVLAYGDRPMALGVRHKNIEKTEFAPYLTAFLNLKAGERWNEIEFRPGKSYGSREPWQLKGRVLGEETVSVPAGTFKAIKVEVSGVRDTGITNRAAPSVIEHTLWYVPEIKRVVRQETNSSSSFAQARGDRDIYELVDYKPAGKAPAASNQVASTAAPAQLAAAESLPAAFPRIGDNWTYRHVDGWKNTTVSTIDYRVTVVSATEVREHVTQDGRPQIELAYRHGLTAIGVRYGDVEKTEFSPYLSAFMKLEKDQRFGDIEFKTDPSYGYGHPWKLKARIVGEETVSVPAGKFKAIRVEVTGTRDTEIRNNSSGMAANAIQHTLWYVPEIKRVVRQESNSSTASAQWRGDRDIYELVSYTLN